MKMKLTGCPSSPLSLQLCRNKEWEEVPLRLPHGCSKDMGLCLAVRVPMLHGAGEQKNEGTRGGGRGGTKEIQKWPLEAIPAPRDYVSEEITVILTFLDVT